MDYILKGFILVLLCGVIGVVTDEVKSVSVYEGDSVTLHTDIVIRSGDKILWRFEEAGSANLVVQMLGNKITYNDYVDGRFKDRLQISDTQTGDLAIKNMRIKHTGLYEAEINTATGTSYKTFNVTVKESPRVINAGPSGVKSVSVKEGESVTLQTDVQTQRDDLILWRFGDEGVLIAKVDMEDNKTSVYDDDDGSFKDRLKINNHTGGLIITDSKIKYSGVFQLKIISNKQTLYKTFSVTVREVGRSSGVIAGLCVFFLLVIAAVIAAGVIFYRRIPTITISVTEGDSVTLPGAKSKLKNGAQIEWKVNSRVIMTGVMTKDTGISDIIREDQQFKGRLKLNPYFGCLIIYPVSNNDTGVYEVKITNNNETLRTRFHVKIIDNTFRRLVDNVSGKFMSAFEGDSVTLPGAKSVLQQGAQIEWKFKDRKIITGKMTEDTGITEIKMDDQQFTGRLKFNPYFGSLIINDISKKDTGIYEVNITYNNETTRTRFHVDVTDSARTYRNDPAVDIPLLEKV